MIELSPKVDRSLESLCKTSHLSCLTPSLSTSPGRLRCPDLSPFSKTEPKVFPGNRRSICWDRKDTEDPDFRDKEVDLLLRRTRVPVCLQFLKGRDHGWSDARRITPLYSDCGYEGPFEPEGLVSFVTQFCRCFYNVIILDVVIVVVGAGWGAHRVRSF